MTDRDAVEVLKVMTAREDWPAFYAHLGLYDASGLLHYILDETGLLLEEAVEFMRRGK